MKKIIKHLGLALGILCLGLIEFGIHAKASELNAKTIQNFEWMVDESSFGTDSNGGTITYELLKGETDNSVKLTVGNANSNGNQWIAFSMPQHANDWTGMEAVEFSVENLSNTPVTFIFGFEDGNERWVADGSKNAYFYWDETSAVTESISTLIPEGFKGKVQIPFSSFTVHQYCFPEDGRNGIMDLANVLPRLYFDLASEDSGESIIIDDFKVISAIGNSNNELYAKVIQNYEWLVTENSLGTDSNGGAITYELLNDETNKSVKLTAGNANSNGNQWIAFSMPQYTNDWTGMKAVEFSVENLSSTSVTFIYGFEDGNERWIADGNKNAYFYWDETSTATESISTMIPAGFKGKVQIPFSSFSVHQYCFPESGRNQVMDLDNVQSRLYFELSSGDSGESIIIDDFKVLPVIGTSYDEIIIQPTGNYYNYCPSIIQEGNDRYTYYCSNAESDVIIDYVMMKKEVMEDNEWVTEKESIVLSPSETEGDWDSVHTCDPFVIKGSFSYLEEDYSYLMLYLGCKTLDNSKNEIGIAVSKTPEGPWIKYQNNPIITHGDANVDWFWGVGQASAVNLNNNGEIMLFYTRDDEVNSRGVYRNADFSDLDNIILSEEMNINQNGFVDPDGEILANGNRDFYNFEIAYMPTANKWIGIRDAGPYAFSLPIEEQNEPLYVSTYQELFIGDYDVLWNQEKSWEHITYITPEMTGYQRNHNAGILTDAYGKMLTEESADVLSTGCNTGANNLWNYRMHWYKLGLSNE